MDELEKMKQENANLQNALNYERSERKRLSKELASRDDDESEEIKKAIMKAMEDNSVYSFENEALKVTYVAPTTRTTIDSARLKKELPEIAEKYTKRSDVKASLRITIKGEQK